MAVKIPLLIGLGLGTFTFAAWGAVEANNTHNKHKYNQKMDEYSQLRKEFYENELYDQVQMCSYSDINECLKQENKEYLPAPNENTLWQKAYEGYIQEYKNNPKNIKNLEAWKDYCYEEVKTAIYKKDETRETNYFNVSEYSARNIANNKYHSRCVLGGTDLKKIIEK